MPCPAAAWLSLRTLNAHSRACAAKPRLVTTGCVQDVQVSSVAQQALQQHVQAARQLVEQRTALLSVLRDLQQQQVPPAALPLCRATSDARCLQSVTIDTCGGDPTAA